MVYHLGCEFSPPYALMNEGTPNVRQRSSNIRATPCASFDGNGYPNRNFDALSTTSNKYSLPASDVFGNLCKSTSNTSHGSRNLAGSMAMRGYVTAFCVCTRTTTRNLAYPYTFDQWNLSHISGNVRASHGWPCWQCTEARRSGTRHCGTASTGVFLANTPSHSGRISNTYSARHLSTPLAPSCPPYYPALAWPCPIAGPLPAS